MATATRGFAGDDTAKVIELLVGPATSGSERMQAVKLYRAAAGALLSEAVTAVMR